MLVEASASFGDPVDDIFADGIASQESSASPAGITMIGNAQGSVGEATNVEIFSPGNTSTCARQPVAGP